jgi:hypothetical protein
MEGRAHRTGPRLAAETSVLVLLAGAWLWGIIALGAHATAAQGPAPDGGGLSESAAVSCPAPRGPEEGAGSAAGSDVCRAESRLHVGTSRQPGRSSENNPSTHSGE